jgi:hypothetical protein
LTYCIIKSQVNISSDHLEKIQNYKIYDKIILQMFLESSGEYSEPEMNSNATVGLICVRTILALASLFRILAISSLEIMITCHKI